MWSTDYHTVMQQISEYCKVKPFFMLYIVHRSEQMVDSMGRERYQTITHRFHQAEFRLSEDASLDLIAGSINTRIGMAENWKEERKQVIKRIKPFLPEMLTGVDDKVAEKIDLLCIRCRSGYFPAWQKAMLPQSGQCSVS